MRKKDMKCELLYIAIEYGKWYMMQFLRIGVSNHYMFFIRKTYLLFNLSCQYLASYAHEKPAQSMK